MNNRYETAIRRSKKIIFYGFKKTSLLGVALVLFIATPIQAEAKQRYVNPLGMEFILVDPGVFTMGSPLGEGYRAPSETPHPVEISESFYMMTTEVTLGQWWTIMGKPWIGRQKGTPDMPVTKVSWFDCTRFINRLNEIYRGTYRLPTEAQWEYASRAGSHIAFAWGNELKCDEAMFANSIAGATDCMRYSQTRGFPPNRPAIVKSYTPNAWGLFDMHGNVWEWCQDWYGDYFPGSVKDPQGPGSGIARVRRGGSFFGPADLCRSANRAHAHPASRLNTSGFRLVWSPTGEKFLYPDEPPSTWDKEPDGP